MLHRGVIVCVIRSSLDGVGCFSLGHPEALWVSILVLQLETAEEEESPSRVGVSSFHGIERHHVEGRDQGFMH